MGPGFLPGSRGSFILDFVVVAMVVAIPVLLWSVSLARRGRYDLHRRVQVILAVVLGLAVLAFELDMRLFGWRHLAEPSPYYETLVWPVLWVHLVFAVPTLLLWTGVVIVSLRRAAAGALPGAFGRTHRLLGRLAAGMMVGTAVTGWIFYYLAFIG